MVFLFQFLYVKYGIKIPNMSRFLFIILASALASVTPYIWEEKLEGLERINSMRETNGSFHSCSTCKISRLHELHESKLSFSFETFDFSAHVSGVCGRQESPDPDESRLAQRVLTNDRFLALDGNIDNVRRATGHKTLLYYNLAITHLLIKEEACELRPLASHPPTGVNKPTYLVLRKGLQPLRRDINTM